MRSLDKKKSTNLTQESSKMLGIFIFHKTKFASVIEIFKKM